MKTHIQKISLSLLLPFALIVPFLAAPVLACLLEVGDALETPVLPPDLRGCALANSCFETAGPYNFYGRSLLIGVEVPGSQQLLIRTLDRYMDYPEAMVPTEQLLTLSDPILDGFSFALCERVIGAETAGSLHPRLLNFIGDPILILAGESSGAIKIVKFSGDLIGGPYLPSDLGLTEFHPQRLAFDNDNLRLLAFEGETGNLRIIHFEFEEIPIPSYEGDVSLAPLIGTRPVLSMDYIEASQTLLLLLDFPREAMHIDVSNPSLPLLVHACPVDPTCLALSASEGYVDLDQGIGQWVGLCEPLPGSLNLCTTPAAPSPVPIPYPVASTYLEPRVGISFAYDPRESLTGPLEIRGAVDGPWWPENMRAFYSYDDAFYIQFANDLSGSQVAEITDGPSPSGGDGWRVQYDPANDEEEDVWIQLCYEIERNGTLIYIQDSVRIQDALKPVIGDPENDGDVVDSDESGEGEIQHPDPSAADCTVVTRREVDNDIADDIVGEAQVRDGLPIWKYYIKDENGNIIDSVEVPGGTHCAPTAAIQNIIAMAQHNECLCRKLNCFVGNPPDQDCAWLTPEQITELILVMGIAMETNKVECGSYYDKACKGIEKFLEIVCAETANCSGDCDPKLYCHFILSGNRGDSLYWVNIVEEMDEKDQTVMLRLTQVTAEGDTFDHRVSIVSISRQVGPCVEVEIADPWTVSTYTITIDTRTIPPTIKDDGAGDGEWQSITGAIAVSDSTPQEGGDRSGALDEEYHIWETVQIEPGASTTFPIENLTPGFWKYRVRVYSSGDSATSYRQIYVPEPHELTAIRSDDDIQLNWNGDPYAVSYILMRADSSGAPFDTFAVTADTFYVTPLDTVDFRLYQVITNFTAP